MLHHATYYPPSAESAYTDLSFPSAHSSPDTFLTNLTSPDTSPREVIRQHGPPLLPKIRCQDQTAEPPSASSLTCSTSTSLTASTPLSSLSLSTPLYYSLRPSPPLLDCYPHPHQASISPAALTAPLIYDSAAPSPTYTFPPSALQPAQQAQQQRRPSQLSNHIRTASAPAPARTHSRSSSTASVDEATLWRHGYPTQYRTGIPQYVTANNPTPLLSPAGTGAAMQRASSTYLPLDSPATPSGTALYPPAPTPPLTPHTTTLLSYLTSPNPAPALIRRVLGDQRRLRDWYWWDVRNLRSWSDFNLSTILSIPSFPHLLNIPIDASALPTPRPGTPSPETEFALRDVHASFFGPKLGAALRLSQGPNHLRLQPHNSATSSPTPRPDFLATYPNSYLTTHSGAPRGRLVGLVKAYDAWNSAQRSQAAPAQVAYLRGLAHLQRVMRDHGCRYGFIITEIELVVVRAGAEDSSYTPPPAGSALPDEGPVPIFGQLDVAAPIRLSTHGGEEDGTPRLTAGLALWYLHMLARETSLPGQYGWKLGVGGPAALTRQNCRERDSWMPKAGQGETREARRVRGWVWPGEGLSRKEHPKRGRRG
ncbi:hypothetical protein EJ06DRAFT_560096 [Trichodelitschia bisporula]|uniref:Sialidase n=1 Tax=Trichodelitschia bisporula TaxID=703511 RepID=A0A6G1HJA6_9PEZI|nr:hypothetical protein EJ06DRAFT_560096 [Trichodelitschia bisporula]